MRLLVALLLMTPALGGCLDGLLDPGPTVHRTQLEDGQAISFRTFQVIVQSDTAVPVRITATETTTGQVLEATGASKTGQPVSLELEDGTWDVRYYVDGKHRETFSRIRVDAAPPVVTGLERSGAAQGGSYTIGRGADWGDATRIEVYDLQTGRLLSTSLPYTVKGLTGDRIYAFHVGFADAGGNWANFTVQVRVGDATALPDAGSHTFGVVARYTNEVRFWDITAPETHLTPAQARTAAGDQYLGAGYQITPQAQEVQAVVDQVVTPGMTTTEAAIALFRWLFDHTEYTEERLEATDLLAPKDTIAQGGGVCRDLAALYVSLLRAAGIPARLVSGYLSGAVNGFHAWVEYYGHPDDPWVPVDVSPVDGRWDDPVGDGHRLGPQTLLTAFGVHHADYLTLRQIPQSGETEGWSTALSVRYTRDAQLDFGKQVADVGFDEQGVLCVNDATRDRATADDAQGCDPGRFPNRRHVPGFLEFAVRQIDYGIILHSAPPGAEITMEVATPFVESVLPDKVEYIVYGNDPVQSWQVDVPKGLVRAEVRI